MVVATATEVGRLTRAPGFDAFYRDERARLFRALALTLGNSDLAAEAVDEAMVRAYQRWNRVSSYDNPSGWVYRVGLNWGISRARRAVRRPLLHTSLVTAGPDVPDTELAAAVAALPPRHRAVVVLRFDLDWSLEQIATALNVPTGTVKSRLHRALAVLRENLEDDRES
jgi:RNA polymerase sigma-70 factor (ECF subfamily)